jgi:hypothetical protein
MQEPFLCGRTGEVNSSTAAGIREPEIDCRSGHVGFDGAGILHQHSSVRLTLLADRIGLANVACTKCNLYEKSNRATTGLAPDTAPLCLVLALGATSHWATRYVLTATAAGQAQTIGARKWSSKSVLVSPAPICVRPFERHLANGLLKRVDRVPATQDNCGRRTEGATRASEPFVERASDRHLPARQG